MARSGQSAAVEMLRPKGEREKVFFASCQHPKKEEHVLKFTTVYNAG